MMCLLSNKPLIENLPLLKQVAQFIINGSKPKPSEQQVVEGLLQAEKTAKKSKENHTFEELWGTWRLCFITGTRKGRKQAKMALGMGRYLPHWMTITLSYSPSASENIQDLAFERGKVENTVKLGTLKLSLSGPVKFFKTKNILAFDFTRMVIHVSGLKLYDGFIRGGKKSEEKFWEDSLKNQAFFAYFVLEDPIIAARGRGGGLALWGKQN